MTWRRGVQTLAIVALPLFAARGHAQASASVDATAELTNTAPASIANQDLDFGAVLPGFPVSVDPRTAPNAGWFTIDGAQGAEVAIQFTLPSLLTAGPEVMPIGFSPTDGCHVGRFQFLRVACANFDPAQVLTRTIPFPAAFSVVYVWIGGTVTPAPAQAAGNYRATISLTAAYTGN